MALTLLLVMVMLVEHGISSTCPQDRLAVYRLSLETWWSEEVFPKQYPQWRPPAQWSKTIGEASLPLHIVIAYPISIISN